ncbi:thrombospondin type 3 repeat-containing protein [Niabella aurantiaca]|uniref:thrombospondin type 3 repeat-containing protein n=1 Tax=Niabella aurantiaca TaxID=379900 RepID=UPI00037D9D0F|nr:thrombospondin type 3 repeat-containing protein [Niabella aurantiaca]
MTRGFLLMIASFCCIQAFSQYAPDDDFDGDGVKNSIDLDDDNDGIPDVDECNQSHFYWSGTPSPASNPAGGPYTTTGTINGIAYTYTSSAPVLVWNMFQPGNFPAAYGIPLNAVGVRNDAVTTNTLTFASPMLNPVLVFASIGSSSIRVPIQFNNDFDVVWSNAGVIVNKAALQISGAEGNAIVRFKGLFSSLTFSYQRAETYATFMFGADFPDCPNTDGDAILLNQFDADSDNDGCPDAIEGAASFTMASLDGNLRLTGGVDANGVPLAAGAAGQQPGTAYMAGVNACDPVAYPVTKTVTGAPVVTNLADKPLQGSSTTETSGAQVSWTGRSATITSLPTNGFILTYGGHTITQDDIDAGGYVITNYDPALLSIAPGPGTPGGTTTTSFNYAVNGTAVRSADAVYTVTFSQSLPVTFGPVSAVFKSNDLVVTWTTETETNNDHFEIEASADGSHFTNIGSVQSLSPGGNSKEALHYQFRKTVPADIGLALGIGLLALGGLGGVVNRKRRMSFILIMLLGSAVLYTGCAKKETLPSADGKLYIRVAQVDKDGSRSYSKVIRVVKE